MSDIFKMALITIGIAIILMTIMDLTMTDEQSDAYLSCATTDPIAFKMGQCIPATEESSS